MKNAVAVVGSVASEPPFPQPAPPALPAPPPTLIPPSSTETRVLMQDNLLLTNQALGHRARGPCGTVWCTRWATFVCVSTPCPVAEQAAVACPHDKNPSEPKQDPGGV